MTKYEWDYEVHNSEDDLNEVMFQKFCETHKDLDYVEQVLIPEAWRFEVEEITINGNTLR